MINASALAASLHELERKRDHKLARADEAHGLRNHTKFAGMVGEANAYGEAARMLRSLLEVHRAEIMSLAATQARLQADAYVRPS